MTFKENRQRFMEKNNLVFLGIFIVIGIGFALCGVPGVTRVYGWAIMIYSSFVLLGPADISKTCTEKRTICFSLCLVGGAILDVLGSA